MRRKRYTSGLAGMRCGGTLYDKLVDLGGTAIFEEIVEAIGLGDLLESRGADENAKREIRSTYDKALEYCALCVSIRSARGILPEAVNY